MFASVGRLLNRQIIQSISPNIHGSDEGCYPISTCLNQDNDFNSRRPRHRFRRGFRTVRLRTGEVVRKIAPQGKPSPCLCEFVERKVYRKAHGLNGGFLKWMHQSALDSILSHGRRTWMIWGTPILGNLHMFSSSFFLHETIDRSIAKKKVPKIITSESCGVRKHMET